jgi:hypothetical protein
MNIFSLNLFFKVSVAENPNFCKIFVLRERLFVTVDCSKYYQMNTLVITSLWEYLVTYITGQILQYTVKVLK